ncbi:restriction endonuclease fold toxin-2 domain-containing protein [Solirubrobacter deserti]|uniref:Tox-REase-2 domain-containing protein n=1 Tax=Solirubrobacter deserti TaxID=2282478 RepID=A0ABT4RNN5_9ACTN|nr:restriction endonuclease fold toxin-2 domain-containing protein [Solirubrobacter deserti]MDA0140187.1 hypothetical protein [Solirubrobacter deserti]
MPESFAGITVPEGEPGGLRSAARAFNAFAIEVDGCSSRMGALPGQLADWQGPASARFAGAASQHADAARGAVSALSAAGQAAARYAEALDEAQDEARAAIEDAREATRRIRRLEEALTDAQDRETAARERAASATIAVNTAAASGTPDPAAESMLTEANTAAGQAAADQVRISGRLQDARADLKRAKKRGEKAEEAAREAGQAAAGGFAALGDAVLYVSVPGANSEAAVGAGHIPPMYPPKKPGRGPMSDAASGDGYRTHGDPLRFHRQYEAEKAAAAARRRAEEEEDDGGLFSDIVHGGLDVVGMIPVVGEPADLLNAGIYAAEGDMVNAALSGGAALPFVGMAATGAKWGKRGVDAVDSMNDVAKHAPTGGYPTLQPFDTLPPAKQAESQAWQDGLRQFQTPTHNAAGKYEVEQTGPNNFSMEGGGQKIDADGYRAADGSALEAKHVGSADRSPYVPDSNAPQFLKDKTRRLTEGEIERYAAIVRDPGNPVRSLEVITNDPRAVPYFEEILAKYDLPSRVIVRGTPPS